MTNEKSIVFVYEVPVWFGIRFILEATEVSLARLPIVTLVSVFGSTSCS